MNNSQGPATSKVSAKIEQGLVIGNAHEGVAVYRSIPYAAPPVGPLRWKPPKAPSIWTEPRDATQNGPVCPQIKSSHPIFPPATIQSEDCLSLSIFAPIECVKAPVMVWFHGGGHRIGAGSQLAYEGHAFARQGVILVTINYRLGAFGYFAHPALTADALPGEPLGNYGDMDKVAALHWVKRNIAAFGGDPENITAFGESAGGQSLLYLLANPECSRGLINKAIIQSGGGWFSRQTLAEREVEGVRTIGVLDTSKTMDAEALRSLPAETVVALAGNYRPFIDGQFYRRTPIEAFVAGLELRVPLVIGANDDEGSLIDMLRLAPDQVRHITGDLSKARLVYGINDDHLLARKMVGDALMVAPGRYLANLASQHGTPIWHYSFNYVPESIKRLMPNAKGAIHGVEVSFVFNQASSSGSIEIIDPVDTELSVLMNGCWTAFARTAVPVVNGIKWPSYGSGEETMVFGEGLRVVSHYRKPELDYHVLLANLTASFESIK